eukprot:jgi/Botrbrau1/14824/Bobra.168_3s0006.1
MVLSYTCLLVCSYADMSSSVLEPRCALSVLHHSASRNSSESGLRYLFSFVVVYFVVRRLDFRPLPRFPPS